MNPFINPKSSSNVFFVTLAVNSNLLPFLKILALFAVVKKAIDASFLIFFERSYSINFSIKSSSWRAKISDSGDSMYLPFLIPVISSLLPSIFV